MEIFGLDQAFNQVSDLLKNEGVGGVGIYGMGGVGKTTLMRKIHQDFFLAHEFQIIWITVSDYLDQKRCAADEATQGNQNGMLGG